MRLTHYKFDTCSMKEKNERNENEWKEKSASIFRIIKSDQRIVVLLRLFSIRLYCCYSSIRINMFECTCLCINDVKIVFKPDICVFDKCKSNCMRTHVYVSVCVCVYKNEYLTTMKLNSLTYS